MGLDKIVIASLLPGYFLASVDIQDAYLHIPFISASSAFFCGRSAFPNDHSTLKPIHGPTRVSSWCLYYILYISLIGQSLTKESILPISVRECPVDSVDPAEIWLDHQTLKVPTGPYSPIKISCPDIGYIPLCSPINSCMYEKQPNTGVKESLLMMDACLLG